MAIVSWSDYNSLYSKINEDEFDKYEALAEKEIKNVIGPIGWSQINEDTFGYDVLKDCICNVMDKIADDESSGRGRGIASVSNDGYTETYSMSSEADLRNEMKSSIKGWLSGTGLVRAY